MKTEPKAATRSEAPSFKERLEGISRGNAAFFPGTFPRKDRLQAQVLAIGLLAINETIERLLEK